MGVGVEGGFPVPTQFWPAIMQTPVSALVRPRATVIPPGSPPDSPIDIPTLDTDLDVSWIGEGDAKPEDSFALKVATLTPREVAASATVSDKLLRNWAASSTPIETIFKRAVSKAEDTAFLTGSGIGRPLGILNSPAAINVGRAAANLIAYADVTAMLARIIPGGEPTWIASPTIISQLATLVDAGSHATWQSYRELFGIPLIFSARLPALGSAGDLMLVDLSYYLIADGSGPFVVASNQSSAANFTSNKTVIKIFWNVDGQPWLSAPIPLEGSAANTVSPFVSLAA